MGTTAKERTVRIEQENRRVYIEGKPGPAERTVKVN